MISGKSILRICIRMAWVVWPQESMRLYRLAVDQDNCLCNQRPFKVTIFSEACRVAELLTKLDISS